MKRIYIGLILVICILLVGLSFSSLFAEDFSFIGINWNDNFDTVRKKINESGLPSDSRFTGLQRGSIPLSSIIKNPVIDEERHKVLTNIASKIKNDLGHEHQLKYIEFSGKRDSMVKNASFFFAYDRDILLAYDIFLNIPIAKLNEETGEGEFYQDLVKKYGTATKTLKWSRVWLQNDQTLYYTAVDHAVIVTYISESNLSSYIARIGVKSRDVDDINGENRAKEFRLGY
jgi:hypothetical protein